MNATNVQFGEPLLEFRLAYLRAIAKAWSDPELANSESKCNDRMSGERG